MKKTLLIFGLMIFLSGCNFGSSEEKEVRDENVNTNTSASTINEAVTMTEEDVEIANEELEVLEEVLQDPTENMSDVEVKEAQERDRQRIKDVEEIQEVLEKYYEKNESYPETLDVLVSEYMNEIPKDPNTDEVYSYTPIGKLPAQYYDLVYELEAGVNDQDFGLQVVNPELR